MNENEFEDIAFITDDNNNELMDSNDDNIKLDEFDSNFINEENNQECELGERNEPYREIFIIPIEHIVRGD